jgi:tRNA(fMet)-specific endonuclease VapC
VANPAFLLDTNILVYLLADLSGPLRARVEQCEPGSLVTSTLCVAEAAYGLRGNPAAEPALARLLYVIPPLPFDLAAANRFPRIPFHRGRLDRFIAAHALSLDLAIVTNNERDFSDITGLRIENWTKVRP